MLILFISLNQTQSKSNFFEIKYVYNYLKKMSFYKTLVTKELD